MNSIFSKSHLDPMLLIKILNRPVLLDHFDTLCYNIQTRSRTYHRAEKNTDRINDIILKVLFIFINFAFVRHYQNCNNIQIRGLSSRLSDIFLSPAMYGIANLSKVGRDQRACQIHI